MMTGTKADKATVLIQQGQRVYSGLYGGRHGVVIAVHGEQSPASVGTVRGVLSYGGRATVDVAFPGGISRGIPESIIRGVQWEIFAEVATADEILDAIAEANAAVAEAKRKELAAAEAFRAECDRLRADPANAHLTQGEWTDGKTAAANVRKELKRQFPGVKFSVRLTKGDGIDVSWTDGPTVAQVKAVAGRHATASYDANADVHGHDRSPFASVFGGVGYVFTDRETTAELEAKAWRAAYPNGLTCEGETIPADLPADWRQRYYGGRGPGYWIGKTVNEFAG